MRDSIRFPILLLVAFCLVVSSGCGDDDDDSKVDAGTADKDASGETDDSGMDSGPRGTGGETGGTSAETGGTGGEASECTMLVGAECDGDEDCDGDEVCCGVYTGTGYSSIDCQADCPTGNVRMCHYGESCDAEDGTTYDCASSGFLPASFGVCVASLGPATEASSSAVAGEINCGDTTCGEGEKCCLRGITKDPYCTDLEDECLCDETPSEDDAGA